MQKVLEMEDLRLAGSSSSGNEPDPPAPSALCPHPILGERLGGGHDHAYSPRGSSKQSRPGFAYKHVSQATSRSPICEMRTKIPLPAGLLGDDVRSGSVKIALQAARQPPACMGS